MDATGIEEERTPLELRRDCYAFLATIFLTPIPTPGSETGALLLEAIEIILEQEDDPKRAALLGTCLADAKALGLEKWQQELAVDRTRLCRAAGANRTVVPPYEALYLHPKDEGAHLSSIALAYADAGLSLGEDAHERLDYLGVELSFVAYLLARQQEALAEGNEEAFANLAKKEDSFIADHLARWTPLFCDEVDKHAATPFFMVLSNLMRDLVRADS